MNKLLKILTGDDNINSVDYNTLFSKSFNRSKTLVYFDNLPIPFLWTRVLLFMSILGLVSYLNTLYVGAYAFAWLTLIISSIIPITISVFLYEMIKDKKIDMLSSVIIFVIGITLSFFLVGQLAFNSQNEILDTAILAPIIEEVAKFLTVFIMIKYLKIKQISYAIFVGYLVGAGFQVAETMGYATFWGLLDYFRFDNLGFDVLFTRSLYSFNSHALWTALHAIGIMITLNKKNNLFILKWSIMAVILHALWNFIAVINIPTGMSELLLAILQFLFVPIIMLIIKVSIHDAKKEESLSEEIYA